MAVLTLLAPAHYPLSPDAVQMLCDALHSSRPSQPRWLHPGQACEIALAEAPTPAMKQAVEATIGSWPIDFALRASKVPIKLLISDMDSTMIEQECIDELADFVGKKAEVSAITERAMRGELEFEAALTHRVALLEGLEEATLQRVYDERITFSPGAKELLAGVKARGAYTVLVSGGFTFFTSRVAAALGFDEDHANWLEIVGGKLTGKVLPPILGKEAKLATLLATCERLGITTEEVMALGDGANDLPMLQAAGIGVAYRAKPIVRAETSLALDWCKLEILKHL